MKFSTEYIGALVILLASVLQAFGLEIGTNELTGLVTGLIAIFMAFKRWSRGDISVLGRKS